VRAITVFAAAIAMMGTQAFPALAGGGSRLQAHGGPPPQHRVHQQHSHQARNVARHDMRGVGGEAHTRFGGRRLEQRADPNNQNPYRPMFSLDATNPGETHPYFRTRKEGFGYPPVQSGPVYLGNGVYVIPR